ncbi:MAG: glutathione S-transferase N-terminal domain-containing protein [Pseudomonadota bacterium]
MTQSATTSEEQYQLFHFDFCPFCMRVRQFLERNSLTIPLRNIHRDRAAYDELVQGGGSQQVPCLRIERDGNVRWLYESEDIIHYLAERAADGSAS